MKSKKVKIEKKASKKSEKRVAKKELETNITNKFLDVIRNLGHEAGNLTKDVKKLSKTLAKKLADKVSSIKEDSSEKVAKKRPVKAESTVKRAVRAPKKGLTRAQKITPEANTGSVPARRPAPAAKIKRAVKTPRPAGTQTASSADVKKIRTRRVKAESGISDDAVKPARSRATKTTAATPAVRKPRVKRAVSTKTSETDLTLGASADSDRTNSSNTL